ncbi:putative pentatricopeptide repeat-containing protein At1g69350, mitochondrial [Selaginella moellendorffii]|uniref:putative pentatricopeptide repeat-containing protein At1g69350, mitochondrial n=1 Tax=Selaginella moellendorffii TaxID=88036 RepID=UPI000D1C6FEE|nr:putative pentatricopeptide repeat-containing protein At1g69350, mitochondrial [Selaginella moellendorffii]|eukprot:XP_024534116.1 putative pentatricopeptide repeat-containing protein At1g69350, mitochondrial [Selaginella moellendorffii]
MSAVLGQHRQCRASPDDISPAAPHRTRASIQALAALLRQCRDLREGITIHARLRDSGQDSGTLLGNLLLQMYGRCRSAPLARAAFDHIAAKNIYSWTMMISAYAQNGHPWEALQIFHAMDLEGVLPDEFVFSAVLGACCKAGALGQGRAIHQRISRLGLHCDVVIQNSLVIMYAKSGSLGEACQVFDSMAVKDVISWNSMLAAFAKRGHYETGLELFGKIDVEPDLATFVIVLGLCCSPFGDSGFFLVQGRLIHQQIVSRQLESDLVLQNALLNMYAKRGSITEARDVFNRMSRRDHVSWNAMIAANAHTGDFLEAFKLLRRMELDGVKPDDFTFSTILLACASSSGIRFGKEILSRALQCGTSDQVVQTAALNMYAKGGSLEEARALFEEMEHRDTVSWSAMISAHAQFGHSREALQLYRNMCLEGAQPDSFTFSSVIEACSELRDLESGKSIHARVASTGMVERDLVVGTSLVDLYAKCGELEPAKSIFDAMQRRNTVTWNAMLAGYAQHGYNTQALELYELLLSKGTEKPDSYTCATILSVCANMVSVKDGREIHAQLADQDFVVATALMDMYAKCGSFNEAAAVFWKLKHKDSISWNAMLATYAHFGQTNEAIHHLRLIFLEGIAPNELSFNTILHACSHRGLLKPGYEFFVSMSGDHGIFPNADNFHCMTDLLARSGQLREAEDLINAMPFEPQALAWTTLLSACSQQSDAKGADDRAAGQIIDMRHHDAHCYESAPYILLSSTKLSNVGETTSQEIISSKAKKE